MADEADIANDFIANEVRRALNKVPQNTGGKLGPKRCSECDDVMPDARRNLGFQICVPCASESERRKALYSAY